MKNPNLKLKKPKIEIWIYGSGVFFYSSSNNKDNDEPETTNIDQEIAFYEESNQADDFSKYWQNNYEKLPISTAFVKRYCIISAICTEGSCF